NARAGRGSQHSKERGERLSTIDKNPPTAQAGPRQIVEPFRLALSTGFFTQSCRATARPQQLMGFSLLDYGVLFLYLAGITAFGTRFRRTQHSVADYFIGARNIRWWVISLSIVATETSTLTLVGVPAIAFATFPRPEQGGNLTYLQVVVGYMIARVLISVLFVPAYFSGNMLTAYELINRRFGAAAKHVTASLFLIMRPLAEGVRVFAASLVLSAV